MTRADSIPLYDRRRFLKAGLVAPMALRAGGPQTRSCILLWQSGGCSHLDTFDVKPDAPREIRGEFRPIATSVPGIRISEHLPLVARHVHKLTILRSMRSVETNHERAAGSWRAQFAGLSAAGGGDLVRRPADLVEACLAACRSVERGARFITVVQRGYDTHTDNFGRLKDYVLPEFDRALAVLLERLEASGLLDSTLLVVTGEFGRTPAVNALGGRDHHAGAWTAVLAGAGLPGGRVLGATDKTGSEVTDLPVTPADLACTIHAILGAEQRPQLAGARFVREVVG